MNWTILKSKPDSAEGNMRRDEELLAKLHEASEPILHLYEWQQDAATHGCFIHPERFLQMENVKKKGLDLGKRPTGGGIIFHRLDYAFSVLVPASHPSFSINPLENYAFVNRQVIHALRLFLKGSLPALLPEEPAPLDSFSKHFCMAKPTKFDVMIGERKVGGAAQRKTRGGYLHQGSICLGLLPEEDLKDLLHPDTLVLEGMKRHSYPLLGENPSKKELDEARKEIASLLETVFQGCYD